MLVYGSGYLGLNPSPGKETHWDAETVQPLLEYLTYLKKSSPWRIPLYLFTPRTRNKHRRLISGGSQIYNHCNALYVGLPLRLMRKFQMVQNAAARLLSGVRTHQHITSTLATLHWLPVCFRVDFKVLMITYKALNGLGPQYLAERLLPPRSTCTTWSSQEGRLRSLKPREVRKEKSKTPGLLGSGSFEIRLAPSLGIFKKQLKTWLFRQAFPPGTT